MDNYYGAPQDNSQPQAPQQPQATPQPQPAQAAPQPQQTAYNQYAQATYAPQPQAPFAPTASGAAAAPQKKSHTGLIVFGIVMAAVVALLIGAMVSCSQMVNEFSSLGSYGYGETTTYGDTVAVIDIDGTIQYDGTTNSPEGLRDVLTQAEEDDNIKAIVLHVNSGGGTATAGEEMSLLVADCTKPVVVSSASINASAAYMISSQSDYIFVNHTTAIGSIGTVMQTYDVSELMEKLGVDVINIASAESKDSSYGTRPLTDEEIAYYQDLVDKINAQFIELVSEGRGMDVSEVQALATGMEFTGDDAVDNGLADEVGTYDDALAKAAELGGIEGDDYDVVNLYVSGYGDMADLLGLMGYSSNTKISAEDLIAALELLQSQGTVK